MNNNILRAVYQPPIGMSDHLSDIVMSDSYQRSTELLSFTGDVEGEDVSVFLRDVMRVAYTQSQSRNNDWLVYYIQMCLSGTALKWYTSIDEGIQDDFRRLRVALLERFSRPSQVTPMETPINVTPAPPETPAFSVAQRGRLRLTREDGQLIGYCGEEQEDQTTYRCPVVSVNALIVQWYASPSPFGKASIMIPNARRKDTFLGLGRYTPKSNNHKNIPWVLCYSGKDSLRSPCRREGEKELSSSVWSMDSSTGELSASWPGTHGLLPTEISLRVDGERIWLRQDDQRSDACARMFLEPI
ncbi:hypothetical protein FRB94_007315 [Tulasnella sp. JGI-2019a]|nr:hypothetical protein FRB94_007315 [Tulasnella sp. JGI-2019a]